MAQAPVQTYFVPLPEADLFNETFETINSADANAPVNTVISIAIAADGTVVYYDHWEDGYETDVTNPLQTSTQVWGDGNTSNGIAPGTVNDLLSGGDAIVLENQVPVPRGSSVLFDGRDRIQASFPIAVTRGAFPEDPGSLMAGATEVLSTYFYNTSFLAPIGENTSNDSGTNPFQSTQIYVIAGEDNTEVFLNGVSQGTINTGESLVVDNINEGDEVTSSDPVQAHLLSGDIRSIYEIRWYSLVPRSEWSNDYYSPVAEETGSTGFWFYNPNGSQITIDYEGDDGLSGSFTVAGNSSEFIEIDGTGDIDLPDNNGSDNVPGTTTDDYSGLHFSSTNGDFFALAQIDADSSGQIFDWGFPLVPADQLTSQALIGWGYGNTNNSSSVASRSVVWVTPTADGTISVDFNGDGTVDSTFNLDRLEALRLIDPSDQDMTGSIIFATDANGDPVDIAVAWGQDPDLSDKGDGNALDLGTVVPPLPIIDANKTATLLNDVDGDGEADPGDTLRYTIRVVNVGRVDLTTNSLVIDDVLPADTTYVVNSTNYNDGSTTTNIADDGSGTAFPLDGSGLNNISPLEAGEAHEITFDVVIDGIQDLTPGTEEIINTGSVTGGPGDDDPTFETETPLDFDPEIEIQKTVALDHDSGASFGSSVELVQGSPGADVTYYFEVTNTGATYLNSIVIDDNDLSIDINDLTLLSGSTPLAPGASVVYFYETTISGDLLNTATATGNPTYNDGTDLDVDGDDQTDDTVTDDDTAEVDQLPTITVEKLNDANDDGSFSDNEATTPGDTVTFQGTITNTSSETITIDSISDDLHQAGINASASAQALLGTTLAPSDTATFTFDGTIANQDNLTEVNTLTVNVSDDEGNLIAGSDTSTVTVSSISGTVTDDDGNPLENVTIELFDDNGNLIDTVTTDPSGDYSFTGVEPGNYNVVETNLPHYQDVSEVDGQFDGGDDTDGGDNGIVNNIPVTLDPGEADTGNDFVDAISLPGLDIEKFTNNVDADTDAEAVEIAAGDTVTWSYQVTNTGNVPFDEADIVVTDDQEGQITNIIDQGNGDTILAPGETWIYEKTGTAQNLVANIDFDTDLNGNPVPAGTFITNQYAAVGLTVSATEFGAMIFDSANPTGNDFDLATDNLGNILIISEDGDSSDPDDNAGGGTITLDWANPIRFDSTFVLDIEEAGSSIVTFNGNDNVISTIPIPTTGDGVLQELLIGNELVSRIEYNFTGSGAAIPGFAITDIYRNEATVSVGDVLYDSDTSAYINPMTQTMPPLNNSIQIEAEDIDEITGYRIEKNGVASGNQMLSLVGRKKGEVGSATLTFNGISGSYDVTIGTFDENDGQASFTLDLNDSEIGQVVLDDQLGSNVANAKTFVTLELGSSVQLQPGDILTITGWEDASEHARFDFIEFTPVP